MMKVLIGTLLAAVAEGWRFPESQAEAVNQGFEDTYGQDFVDSDTPVVNLAGDFSEQDSDMEKADTDADGEDDDAAGAEDDEAEGGSGGDEGATADEGADAEESPDDTAAEGPQPEGEEDIVGNDAREDGDMDDAADKQIGDHANEGQAQVGL